MDPAADEPPPIHRSLQRRVERDFRLGPPTAPPRRIEANTRPGATVITRNRQVIEWIVAVVVPLVLAAVMLPLRDDHPTIVALVLVVSVSLIATFGSRGPALVAGVVASVAFAVVYTQPHWRFAIEDADNVVTTLVLLTVALVVGAFSARTSHLAASDEVRSRQLNEIIGFTRTTADGSLSVDEVTDAACTHLANLLEVRSCRWVADYHGTAGPVLQPDGTVTGDDDDTSDPLDDQTRVPDHLELPAIVGGHELGRFIVRSDGDADVSVEERLTAVAIVSLFAHELLRRA